MSEKKKEKASGLADIISQMKALREQLSAEIPKLTEERNNLNKKLDDETKKFNEAVAPVKTRIAEINEVLAAAGVKGEVKARAVAGGARGALKKVAADWINKQGVNTTFRYSEFKEGTGITSGYSGVILKDFVDAGLLTQPETGKYTVLGVIPTE